MRPPAETQTNTAMHNKQMYERGVRYWRERAKKLYQILELASRKSMNG